MKTHLRNNRVRSEPDGRRIIPRAGLCSDLLVSRLHGRFYEQALRGNLYTFGVSNTALNAANSIAAQTGATSRPLVGLYNPLGNSWNLVILQAIIVVSTVANTAVSPGGFMWQAATGQAGITTGSSPINLKTLAGNGSNAKAFSLPTALTGLTGSLFNLRPSPITPGVNAAGPVTAKSQVQGVCVDNVDGGLIVPPGGVIVLRNQVSTTTISVSTAIVWEEVPIPEY